MAKLGLFRFLRLKDEDNQNIEEEYLIEHTELAYSESKKY